MGRRKYEAVYLKEDVAKEFRKRAKSLGLPYSEFLKRLMMEYDSRRTKELKEFFELIEGIYRKLDDLTGLLILKTSSSEGSTIGAKEVILAMRELARKLIVLQSERQAFETFIEEILKRS